VARYKNSDPGFELEERFNSKEISGYLQKKFSILATRGLEPSRSTPKDIIIVVYAIFCLVLIDVHQTLNTVPWSYPGSGADILHV